MSFQEKKNKTRSSISKKWLDTEVKLWHDKTELFVQS